METKETLLIIDVNEDEKELACNSYYNEEYSVFLDNLEKIIKEYHSKSWEIIYLPNDRCNFSVYKEFKTNKEDYSDRFEELAKRFPFLQRFSDTEMHIALDQKEIDKIIESTNNSANFAGNYLDECVATSANILKARNPSSKVKVLINQSFDRGCGYDIEKKRQNLNKVLNPNILIDNKRL